MELAIDAIFALLFAKVLVAYARRRDPLQRDLALMFAVVAILFVLAVARQTRVEAAPWVGTLAAALLLGQPFLTVRLVRAVGALPHWIYRGALAGWLLSCAVLLWTGDRAGSGVAGATVIIFVVADGLAAFHLTRLARERRGAPRIRLILLAIATLLFAVAILVTEAGASDPGHATGWQQATRVITVLSELAYLLAFMPPKRLRRAWSSHAAATVVRRLVRMPADAPPETTWRCYATAVCEVTGSSAAVVLLRCGDTLQEVARVHMHSPGNEALLSTTSDGLLSVTAPVDMTTDTAAQQLPPVALSYAKSAGARFVTVIPLNVPTGQGALLLLNRYRSLFTDDDIQLLGTVSGQAAALAQRAELFFDRDRLTDELSASLSALTAASKAKSEFMANMSHELRTPLNAIIGFSELMRSEPVTGDQTTVPTEWVGHIHSSGGHLLSLINQVLDLAKIESGKIDLQCEPLDLPGAVTTVVASLQALSQEKNLEVTVAVAPVRIQADRMRFRQILTNLISNAIKFTPDDGRIFIAARRVGADIAVSIANTGAGIAPEDCVRVFEEFQQVGEGRAQTGGSGLGLALTRRLVEAHGGRIELASELGHGAKFTTYLPAADTPSRPSVDGMQAGPCAGVLIIEDDAPTSRLLATYLEQAGYQVSTADTGEQGLATARSCHPEVILLDIRLPGVDGWQILTELKQDDRLRDIPVVIISAFDDTDVGVALGAVDYFVKPVDRRTLLSWMTRHGLVPPMGTKQMTVLAIDDDPVNLQLIETSLDAEGIQVVSASGGAAGLALAHTRRFDLIICDLIMPDVDGFDVIAALHNNPDTRGTPVVVLTAHTLTETDKVRLSGKVIAVTAKDSTATGLPELARTIGELTGLTIANSEVVA